MKYKTLLFLIFLLFFHTNIYAQVNNTDISYVLEADQVTKIGENTYEAIGNVELQAKGLTITAEKIIYNSKTTEVQASGTVKIESPEQKLEAGKIVYNLNAETGTAEDIQGFLAPFNYLCAKNMNKTGPTTFTVTDAKISACSGSVPEWSLSMYEGKLDIDGYMQLNHATVNIYDSPFVYVPKFFYPVSSNRKTGFLMPNIGYDETMGAMGNFQYFIAPDVNYDFTIGLGLYSERGVQEQFEARYAHSEESKFYIAAEHIKDFGSEADTQSRWRATLKNQYMPVDNLYINLNGDYVSDYLYTRDYDDYSISMFNEENYQNMFFGEFKLKYVNDYIDTQIYYRRDMLYRDTTTGYTQNQLVRMPSIRVNKIVKEIPYVFLEYDLSYDRLVSKNTQYYHTTQNKPKEETEWAMNRFGAYGRLYAPIDAKVLTITPSAYIGYIRWQDSTLPFNFNDYYSPDFGGIYTLNESTAEKYWGGADLTLTVKETADFFEKAAEGQDAKKVANWLMGDFFAMLNRKGISIEESPISAKQLGQLVGLIGADVISGKIAKDVFEIMAETGEDPEKIVEEKGLKQVTDTGAIEAVVDAVIAENPDNVAAYKGGKVGLMGWFVGQVMKKSGGKANPGVVNELLKTKLSM